MTKKRQQSGKKGEAANIWSSHLAWLEITGQEARSNKSRVEQQPHQQGRLASY